MAAGEVKEHGRTLVFGSRLSIEVAETIFWRRSWIVPEGYGGVLPDVGRPVVRLARKLFDELDIFGTGAPFLEVELPEELPGVNVAASGLCVAVPFQDPANVGAVVRSAVGLGASGAFLLPGSANPFHPRSVRTSSGAVFRCRFAQIRSVAEAEMLGFRPIYLDSGGEAIEEFEFPTKGLLVVGVEGPGIGGLCGAVQGRSGLSSCVSKFVRLPMEGIESYNAATAAALAMYEWRRRG